MQENELISLLVPVSSFCGAGEPALLLETATATTTSSPAAPAAAATAAAEPAKNERRRHTNKREQNQMTLKLTSKAFSLQTYYYIEFIMSRMSRGMDQ